MDTNQFLTSVQLNAETFLNECAKDANVSRNEAILNNFEYLIAMSTYSALQVYHRSLRSHLLATYQIDIGDIKL